MAKVLLLHGKSMSADAQMAMGLLARRRDTQVVSLADGHPLLVVRALRTLRRSSATVIHAFGNAALGAAAVFGARRIIFTRVFQPTAGQVRWLRAAVRYRRIDVICSSDTLRRFYVTRGIAADRCHLVRPGVPMALGGDRAALRAALGIAEQDRVIFAPLEATHHSGHQLAMWAASLLNVLDARFKLLVWGTGPAGPLIREFQKRLLDADMLRVADDLAGGVTLRELFAAADCVLLTGSGGGAQPGAVALAMASGKPIVSTTTAAVCEMVEDRHTALLIAEPTPRQVAQRVIDLFEDEPLAWQIADRARAEAYDYFSESKYLAAMDAVYAG